MNKLGMSNFAMVGKGRAASILKIRTKGEKMEALIDSLFPYLKGEKDELIHVAHITALVNRTSVRVVDSFICSSMLNTINDADVESIALDEGMSEGELCTEFMKDKEAERLIRKELTLKSMSTVGWVDLKELRKMPTWDSRGPHYSEIEEGRVLYKRRDVQKWCANTNLASSRDNSFKYNSYYRAPAPTNFIENIRKQDIDSIVDFFEAGVLSRIRSHGKKWGCILSSEERKITLSIDSWGEDVKRIIMLSKARGVLSSIGMIFSKIKSMHTEDNLYGGTGANSKNIIIELVQLGISMEEQSCYTRVEIDGMDGFVSISKRKC